MTEIKITQLTDIGSGNLSVTTLLPVVNMVGVPTTQKTTLGNLANVILSQSGGNYVAGNLSNLAYSVVNAAQPNITSVGTLTNLVVSGNVTVGNIIGNGSSLSSLTGANVLGEVAYAATANSVAGANVTGEVDFAAVANSVNIANVVDLGNIAAINLNGNVSSVLRGDGTWGADANSSYGDSNVTGLLSAFGSNTITTTGVITADGSGLSNVPYANLTGAPTLGNLSSINADGNASNILYGNGTFAAAPSGGGLPLANGNSIIDIATLDGNITLDANSNVWTFGTDGNLTTPSNLVIGPGPGSGSSILQYNEPLQIVGEGPNSLLVMGWTANTSGPEDIAIIGFNSPYTNGASNVVIATGNNATTVHYWNFDNTGALALPGNGYISNPANSSLDPINPNVSTMVLTPDANYSYQALVLDPTAPGHIHLRAPSQSGNIDEPNANLFLGGELSGFEVGASYGIAPNVFVRSNNYTWAFNNDSNLAIPGNINFSGDPSAAPSLNDFFSITSQVNFEIATDTANTYQAFTFSTTGNLDVPGSITANNIGNIAGLNLDGDSSNVLYGNGVFAPITGGGGGNSISDGASNVSVVATDGNVVIGVDNDVASWTFATDGAIYSKSETDFKFTLTDPNEDGYAIKHYVNDGTQDVTLTSLDYDSFRIYTDLPGVGYEWRFQGNMLQVTNNSLVRGFDSNVVIESMYAGGNGTASLRSVSNNNDPNIFTTFDATTTGANISVYNGGSVGGTGYTWRFDNNGNLTLPGNTVAINFANGSAAFSNLVQWTTAPVANNSTGTEGQAAYDAGGNLFVCVANNVWAKFSGTTSW
jgi:hypothetical protein